MVQFQVELQYDQKQRRRNDSNASTISNPIPGSNKSGNFPMFTGTNSQKAGTQVSYNNAMEMVPTAGKLFQVLPPFGNDTADAHQVSLNANQLEIRFHQMKNQDIYD